MNATEEPDEEDYEDLCAGSYQDHSYRIVNEDDPSEEWVFWCEVCDAETWN